MKAESTDSHSFSLFDYFLDSHMGQHHDSGSLCSEASQILVIPTASNDPAAHITPPPELRIRQNDCQQVQQSADQAVRQASQQAADSVRQASDSMRQVTEQAQQSAAAATRSATDAIRQANQSASQSIAAASRSASQALSSASSVVASVQTSASAAISRANASAEKAQGAQSTAQSAASVAVLQAGAAVAAATGKAAAAGSSFLAAAALATQSAGALVSSQAAIASAQVSQANFQATTSQTVAITATQIAIAIVGSIIASALITILIYFLIARHKKNAARKKSQSQSIDPKSPDTVRAFETVRGFSGDSKFPVSDQQAPTILGSRSGTAGGNPRATSNNSFSLFPKVVDTAPNQPPIRSTSVPWDPADPPKPPSLGSWLKLQNTVSPFGPIRLPSDEKSPSPLGGQLKSPLQSKNLKAPSPQAPRFVSTVPLRNPKIPKLSYRNPKSPPIVKRQNSIKRKELSPEIPESLNDKEFYSKERGSKASVWTDDIVNDDPSPYVPSTIRTVEPPSMQLPTINNPVRTTAEWLQDQQPSRSSAVSQEPLSPRQQALNTRPSFSMGLPKKSSFRGGLPSGPRPQKSAKSLRELFDSDRSSRYPQVDTPGVGKAL